MLVPAAQGDARRQPPDLVLELWGSFGASSSPTRRSATATERGADLPVAIWQSAKAAAAAGFGSESNGLASSPVGPRCPVTPDV